MIVLDFGSLLHFFLSSRRSRGYPTQKCNNRDVCEKTEQTWIIHPSGPLWGFPHGSDGKESACNAGDLGSVSGLERSPREGNGNPLQFSCLENSMDRGAWWSKLHEVTKNRIYDLAINTL